MAGYARINLKQVDRLKEQLKNMALSAQDEKQLLTDIGGEMETSMSMNISRFKTDPETKEKWEDIVDSTRKYYEKRGINTHKSRLLFRSGSLRDSITYVVRSKSVLYGATMHYASYLNDGTKKMVSRPFVGISESDYDLLEDRINRFLAKRIK